MNRPEPNAGPEEKSVEEQKTKLEGLFFEQQLQKLIQNRETFADLSEIESTYPGAELGFSILKDRTKIRLSESVLRSLWPSVREWIYADFLAQIRFSSAAEWHGLIVRLLEREGIDLGATVGFRRKAGRPRKQLHERNLVMIGEMVWGEIPRFEKLHAKYDDLRQRFPAQRERWRIELNRAGILPNEIDALLHCKTTISAAIHYVAKRLDRTPHTIQNAFSIYKKIRK
jgi:hypothetical protein